MGGGSFVRTTPLHAETIAARRAPRRRTCCQRPRAPARGRRAAARRAAAAARASSRRARRSTPRTAAAVAALAGLPVTEVLGSSETGGIAWRDRAAATARWQPFPGVTVAADDDGDDVLRSPFAASESRERRARGRPVAAPIASARAHDGRFELLGRADGVVKIGGSRVAVAEIERLLREIPGVRRRRGHRGRHAGAAPARAVGGGRRARRCRSRRCAAPCCAGSSRSRCRAGSAWSARCPREDNGKLVKARLRALFDRVRGPRRVPAAPEQRTVGADGPGGLAFFRGHFDGFPILAGVVQLNEIVMREARACWPEHRHLRRVTALKFRRPIGPGDGWSWSWCAAARPRDPGAFAARARGGAVASSGTFEFLPTERRADDRRLSAPAPSSRPSTTR